MAEDAEKRFHDVMDKIFHGPRLNPSPPSTSSSSSVKNTRGQKHPFSFLEPKSIGEKGVTAQNVPAEEPYCRPWERGDHIRRLATFKSMTWFAKPKVIDAVSCARRGWVNVDVDTIACEVCGARLLFSTPSSWSQEQVDKTALVFSSKLDSGHKHLCPWVNNACDETVVLFPPTPAPLLVQYYKDRYFALSCLSALPKISGSAIKMMRVPQLEHFLKQSVKETGLAPHGSSPPGYIGDKSDKVLANLYYQAHKLLSICGWEPRSLPYIVNCDGQPRQSTYATKDGSPTALSDGPAGEKSTVVTVYHSVSGETVQADEDARCPRFRYDPSSTILECKLCGATIGLWMFNTVAQPIESFRLAGYTEIVASDDLGSSNFGGAENCNGVSSLTKETTPENSSFLNMRFTIAGGPLPINQNFKARISLPVIGRNLGARLFIQSIEEGNVGEPRGNPSRSITDGPNQTAVSVEGDASHHGMALDHLEHVEKFKQGTSEPAVEICTSINPGANHEAGITDEQVGGVDGQLIPAKSLSPAKKMLDGPNGVENADVDQNIVTEQTALSQNSVTTHANADLERRSLDKEMEFHPIKQHRYFCPWVISTDSVVPGWQQTLSALQKESVFSVPDSKDPPPSTSLIKVDDPIKSIRKLFNPPAKRIKSLTH